MKVDVTYGQFDQNEQLLKTGTEQINVVLVQ